jgi:hypothetical protein
MEDHRQRFWERCCDRTGQLTIDLLEKKENMKNRPLGLVVLVLYLFLMTGSSGAVFNPRDFAKNSPVNFVDTPTPVPAAASTSTSAVDIKDFSGRWIAYNVVSLDLDQSVKQKPGMRLEILDDRFKVDADVCDTPKFEIRESDLANFLGGRQLPVGSTEFVETQFQLLSTGCAHLTPSILAKINQRTLAAVIGSDLLYFEQDFSLTVGSMSIESDLLAESSKNPLYEMHAQTPVLKDKANQTFNDLAKQIVVSEMDGFRNGFQDWKIPPEMAGYQSFMWIGYDVPLLTENLVSIRFSVDYYMAGAAHPNHYFKVLNYDLQNDRKIYFSGMFNDPSAALDRFSSLCKANLDKPEFPLFPEGLEPKLENFENWNLTENGLRLSFYPSQVAPYAAGPQEVLISYTEIRPLINPDSAVGAFIAH